MSFLQPWMLWGLPLIGLPILIHLINQRRYQTVPWAAMAFLLTANRMSSGYARIRRWLILAARTIAIAGLLFGVARPLSSGWLGMAVGSRVDTTIVIVDRSPSMSEVGGDGGSKLSTLTNQIIDSLHVIESNHTIWIDEDSGEPIELESIDQLKTLSADQPFASTSSVPAMLETAVDYIRENQPSSVEIWIVSDLRRSDWNEGSGRWSAITQSIREIPQSVRIHLLTATKPVADNRAIRVTSAKHQGESGESTLLLSMTIRQNGSRDDADDQAQDIPLELELNGARSQLVVSLTGPVTEIANHVIPLDGASKSGWGRISLPSDTNPADNDFFFVYGEASTLKTIVVVEDAMDGLSEVARPLMLSAEIPAEAGTRCEATAVTADEFASVDLTDVALVLWTQVLPDDASQTHLQSFMQRGGRVIFFAPDDDLDREFAGHRWGNPIQSEQTSQVNSWIGDHDLLSSVRSGAALPVGDLKVFRYRELEGPGLALASLSDVVPLLVRTIGDQTGAYFVATSVESGSSSLAADGVVLYAMIQRALADGVASLGNTRQLVAGETSESGDRWLRMAGDPVGTSMHYARYAGVYGDDERLVAINRGESEDLPGVVAAERLEVIFEGIGFDHVDQESDFGQSIVQEVWRLFLGLMMLALLLEAVLCLPKARRRLGASDASQSPKADGGSSGTSPVEEFARG